MSSFKLIIVIFAFLFSCKSNSSNNHDLKYTIDEYYQTYAERQDFEKFLAFYDSSMVLEDIVFGERIEGLANFRAFFDWSNPIFELQDSVALIVTDQIIEKNDVVTSGYFTPFTWGGIDVEAMHFTTILRFNTEGKIIQHVDWINYPSYLINYESRKNSNEWINW